MSPHPQDVAARLEDRPGALADLAETLGRAGVNLLGGGVFTDQGVGLAHFLVEDAVAAASALAAARIEVTAVREVVLLRLDQGTPGQLGALCRLMAEAGVNIAVQYSDHDHRLVLVVDEGDQAAATRVAEEWTTSTPSAGDTRAGALDVLANAGLDDRADAWR